MQNICNSTHRFSTDIRKELVWRCMATVAKVGLVGSLFKACLVKYKFLSDNYLQSKKDGEIINHDLKWGIIRNDERLRWCLAFCCLCFAVIISLPSVSACQSEWLICWSRLCWKHRPFCSSEMITSKKASFCGMFLSQGLIPDCALLQNTERTDSKEASLTQTEAQK